MTVIDIYILFRSNPDNDRVPDTHFCTEHGISVSTLRKHKKDCPTWGKTSLDERRKTYAEQMTGVDKALFEAAKDGDTKAADLLYRRFDGWNPKIVEQTNNFYNFTDIVKELRNSGSKTITRRSSPPNREEL